MMLQNQFIEIVELIKQSKLNALKAVNTELINLYWNVGAYISKKLKSASWGEKTVDELAAFIQNDHPDIKGFNRRGLYRMKQFYETYTSVAALSPETDTQKSAENQLNIIVTSVRTQIEDERENVSPVRSQIEIEDIRKSLLVRLSWTHHRTIFSRCKSTEEMFFYLKMTIKEGYSVRELDRQISAGLFERTLLGNKKLPATLKSIHHGIENTIRDNYILEFLNLSEPYNENDLQRGLIRQMKNFILELGKDFLFIAEEYKVQVGNSDFYIDLLFYHRGLQCLVAFELKADKFKPDHMGQLDFYLEALDRDVRKSNENPSIGILLCKDKDDEVVEYALSRSLSPAMVSQYQTQLPDKKLLQQKMHELFSNATD